MPEPLYPNIWGPGQLFAFSGLDGETDWFHPFVASTLAEEPGFVFRLRVPRKLWCEPRAFVVKDLTPRVVMGDAVDFLVQGVRGESFPLRYLFLDAATVLGETSAPMPPVARAEGSAITSSGPDVVTHSSREEHTALVTRRFGEKVLFAFAFSHESAEQAVERATRGLEQGLSSIFQRRLLFYKAVPAPAGADDRRRRAVAKAVSVLKTNLMSAQGLIPCRWSTPDRWPHRDMWLWDSCFHAFGYRVFSVDLAVEQLDAVFAMQDKSGFIAHQMFPAGTSNITQPPLLAWVYRDLWRKTGSLRLIEDAYPRIASFVEWVLANRRVGDGTLLTWQMSDDPLCRSGESGLDNSPRFDSGEPLECVDLNSYVASELGCLTDLAIALKRFGEAAAWKEKRGAIVSAMNERLWDARDGFYYDRLPDGRRLRLRASTGFLPLFAGVPDAAKAKRLVAHLTNPREFWTAFPVPSVALDEPDYELDMWRGPTWLNLDLLIVEGLDRMGFHNAARELAGRAVDGVEHWYHRLGAMYEFYDPENRKSPAELDRKKRLTTGAGIAPIADYNWTAACYLHLVTSTKGP